MSGVLRTALQERFCMETRPAPCGLTVFGASGDLAERKLFPALYQLTKNGQIPTNFYLLGTGRTPLSEDTFRARVREAVQRSFPNDPLEKLPSFLEKFYYHPLRYDTESDYTALATRLISLDKKHQTQGNRLHYLSLPPSLYETVMDRMGRGGLAKEKTDGGGWSRVIIEKPFGTDSDSAHRLDKIVQKIFTEDQTYRIDHYLGKETVQNILVLRFANIFFEPLWNRNFVDHVQITVSESLGVEHRSGYYEGAGCVRDMFQNHLFQLLCVMALEPPTSFEANRVRDETVKVLRSVRPLGPENVVRGQYTAGRMGQDTVLGYLEEKGVSPQSRTETFAAMKLFVDNWRWQGVPFYLRSGKRLAQRRSEVAVRFKHVPHSLFLPLQATDLLANTLVLRIQPQEGVSLSFETKHPGPKLCLSSVDMDFGYGQSFGPPPEAYERLFLDAMAGDQTLFTRADWIHESWSLLKPILYSDVPPWPYASGGWGPAASEDLLSRDGRVWRNEE